MNPNGKTSSDIAIHAKDVSVHYGPKQALRSVSIDIHRRGVTTLIGPSGCGKSTFLRALNRMNDRIAGIHTTGTIRIDGEDPYAHKADLLKLRRKVGMVFQKANPFPMSIYDNVALGPKMHFGIKGSELDDLVVKALKDAALWGEVQDDFRRKSGLSLSGGQQQRLCIARMLAVDPDILLMDEPCSALDPVSTAKVEELIVELARARTLVVVTHNLQQAERISDHTAFFMLGEIVEHGPVGRIFVEAQHEATRGYVSGRFG